MTERRFTAMNSLQYLINKPIIETSALRKIQKILQKTHDDSSMSGVIGEEGIGKSTAAAKYVLSNENAYYIRMGQSYGSKTLFHELIFVMTGKEAFQSTNMKSTIDHLSAALTQSPDKKLVIIDDAGKLQSRSLGLFHELRDNTVETTGFAFLGLQYFLDNLLKWKKEKKIGIAEFYRRVNYWYSIPYLSPQEKLLYLKSKNIGIDTRVQGIIREVTTIWELEAQINIYLQNPRRR